MKKHEAPSIVQVTTADYDHELIRQVAAIESMILPEDSWGIRDITELLHQKHNQCWALLSPDSNQVTKCEVVAYCIWSYVFEVAEILRIGTHPNYQRRGFAIRLLIALIKHMPNKNIEKIMLEVRADNKAAIHLYQKMGFKVIHIRKGYYSNATVSAQPNTDALIMEYSGMLESK